MEKIQIVEMANHFLYLPLYYAQHHKFFGYLPPQYDLEIIQAQPSTDRAALRMLLNGEYGTENIKFAVCDPVPLLTMPAQSDRKPALLASLITNSAIWAFDKDSPAVRTIADLGNFENVISFGQGSTTYAIARRITGPHGAERIISVNPGEEFLALREVTNAIALSPDILKASQIASLDEHFKIILPIGSTKEYNNVMVTALISRQDVISAHPDLIQGLLRALQRSSIIVRCGFDDVIEFAAKRFNQGKSQVSAALDAANRTLVFPVNIAVQKHQWESACEAYYESLPDNLRGDSKSINDAYDRVVMPFLGLAQEAIRFELGQMIGRPMPQAGKRKWYNEPQLQVVVGIALGMIVGSFVYWLAGLLLLLASISLLATTVAIGRALEIKRPSLLALHYGLYLLTLPLIWYALEGTNEGGRYTAASLIAALYIADVVLVKVKR